jgi:glucose/arabinose dehydrogenase
MLYRLLVVALSFSLMGCGGGGNGNGGSNIGAGARVPNVVGMTQANATTAITNAGLKVGTVTQQVNSTVAVGNVISQNPAAGTMAAPLSLVNLVVASGTPLLDLVDAFPNLPPFDLPLFLAPVPAPDSRLVVVEQSGRVKVFAASASSTNTILDVSSLSVVGGEQGLLGLAFDPNFVSNHFFYVFYTCLVNVAACPSNGALRIARYTWDPATPSAGNPKVILTIPHTTATNHNGGMLAFGPDGFLYIGTGDGGGDPAQTGTGQSVSSLLAKILRINVHPANDATPYLVPGDNPLFGGARSEIWAMGFRNPFRFSFDRQTGALWAGDVGQNQFEEIDVVQKGRNYGWPAFEGSHPYLNVALAPGTTHAPPIAEYDHSVGFAIIGGYVYRGTRFAALAGRYVYGDLSGPIWAIPGDGTNQGDVTNNVPIQQDGTITSFGQDNAGELYVVDQGGRVFKFQSR